MPLKGYIHGEMSFFGRDKSDYRGGRRVVVSVGITVLHQAGVTATRGLPCQPHPMPGPKTNISTGMVSRRPLIPYIAGFVFACFLLFTYLSPGTTSSVTRYAQEKYGGGVYPPSRMSPTVRPPSEAIDVSKPWLLKGKPEPKPVAVDEKKGASSPTIGMMGKLTNETARYDTFASDQQTLADKEG